PKPKQFGGLSMFGRALLMIGTARWSGRYKTTPFFGANSEPVVHPKILTDAERTTLMAQLGGV
ncbi:MAG: hypothetical protein AAFX99_13325, partial [Myxococcota bacterium]